jgi:hypothetical protein
MIQRHRRLFRLLHRAGMTTRARRDRRIFAGFFIDNFACAIGGLLKGDTSFYRPRAPLVRRVWLRALQHQRLRD